jgi:diaminohydroxyphosphoribosylaminopyrimidine deaminase / 5-amino-6-(5-phosphoribosylamino)uracil reductase
MPDHAAFMRRALALAGRGWGSVHPNPMVGAVVVAKGDVTGEGWHSEYGGPHAEVVALNAAGTAARGATLYVTLEPCAHHGKTPPCTEAILTAGISEVVYAAADPNPAARGGADRLRAAGVHVVAGVEQRAAHLLDAGFFVRHAGNASFVTLKLALSLDGRIAAHAGARTAITGPAARQQTHRLRSGYDAVLAGINTVLIDDPLLTVREAPVRLAPARVILDSDARLPLDSRLLATLDVAPVIVACAADAAAERIAALQDAGARVVRVDRATSGGVDPVHALRALRDEDIHTVFVEGGSGVATSLVEAQLVDRMHLFISPHFIGAQGVSAFALAQPPAEPWEYSAVERYGQDVLLTLDRAERTS